MLEYIEDSDTVVEDRVGLSGVLQAEDFIGPYSTPERVDGKRVFSYFGGRIAAEIRLYEAIERKLLSPFHYFGVTGSIDLSEDCQLPVSEQS